MRDKESYEEKYGRHSSFRPEREERSGSPIAKWLLVVFLLAFAVLGFDRWRVRHALTEPVAQAVPPEQDQSITPVADAQEPALTEKTSAEPTSPKNPAGQIPAPPALPTQPINAEAAAPIPTVVAKPETEMRYEMRINRSNSFVGEGLINGKKVVLLADTGATMVVVPTKIAQQLGLKKGVPLAFHTGGGDVVHYATTLDKLTLGKIEINNVTAAINPEMNADFVLLGMSALKMMDMEYGEGKLVLKHKQEMISRDMRTVGDEEFKRSMDDCKGQGNKFDQQTLDCLRGR